MRADGGQPRPREAYLAVLRGAGHQGSDASANLIVAREAKRVFGKTLGRSPRKPAGVPVQRGRAPSPHTVALRDQLSKDKAAGTLREPAYYVRWLVNQEGVSLGLKQARPVVYRELRGLQ